MKVKLDASVLDQARSALKIESDEKLGAKLGRSANTVRQWRRGNTVPSAQDLVKLQLITGRPYGTMLTIPEQKEAA